ncbi:glycosyltransferase family 2 protein [Candidatus Shapirobacteria bacterium]|nr:glycosyltransferase family 2 protein [Candidatus Shapirobacteria bacterium]
MTKVAVIILHFHNQQLTDDCLSSVKNLQTDKFRVETIVVNNNPSEKIDALKKKYLKVIFLKTQKNLGFAGGNNLGLNKALNNKPEFLLILNNDTLLDKNLLKELLKATGKDEEIGILGPKIYFAPGYEFHHEQYHPQEKGKVIWYAGGLIDWRNLVCSHRGVDEIDHGQYQIPGETDFVSGCAMLIKKEVLKKIGFFDEKYFLYLEDVDFCQRAKKAGFKVAFVPQAKLWHLNAQSSEVGGELQDYYLTRNRLLFGLRYASLRTKIALLKESFYFLLKGRPWQKIGVRDFYLGRFGQGSFSPKVLK